MASAPRPSSRARLPAVVLLCFTIVGCSPPRLKTVAVSGKTAYAGMGVEEVQLAALAFEAPAAGPVTLGKSGYHGSFVLRLPPGRYRIEGRGRLPARGGTDRELTGHVTVRVPAGAARIDRVMLELHELR